MKLSTLCYIEQNGCYLMLHRNKRDNDENKDKWIGIGGKFEKDESPDECLLREVNEEVGLTLNSYKYRALITFVSDSWETEYMHLFTSDNFSGTVTECNEGVVCWVKKEEIKNLPLWEGDKIFLDLLNTRNDFFSLKLTYDKNEKLTSATLDGKRIL